jgi:hypothetical protein
VHVVAQLPAAFWAVRYVGARYPGAPEVARRPGLVHGANCQLFAYAVLRHFGLAPPALRSSELWADTLATTPVPTVRPLDLILVNATRDAWGAHVGVCLGDDQFLHLSAEVGRPAVWRMADFAARAHYRTVVGIKRVVPSRPAGARRTAPGADAGWSANRRAPGR